jgi:NAD+ synthase
VPTLLLRGRLPLQTEIIAALGISATFDAASEAEKRSGFLRHYLATSRLRAYVLGISGGIDSLTAGLLAQSAVTRLRQSGYDREFVAVRLPYGTQADEWPAAGLVDTMIRCFMKPEVRNATQEV